MSYPAHRQTDRWTDRHTELTNERQTNNNDRITPPWHSNTNTTTNNNNINHHHHHSHLFHLNT